jgi:Mg2+ and Co2+ transporter CorA
MLEKMFKVIKKVSYDIKLIEKQVFEKTDHSLVKDIMIKKRNIVVLKHMFKPQVIVLKKIEETINKIYA